MSSKRTLVSAGRTVSAPAPGVPTAADSNRRMTPRQLLAISAYWFATNLHWMALLIIIIPHQIEQIAPQTKSQAQGWVLGPGAWIAAFGPAIAGALSDRCRSRWGRRRPYIATGVLINTLGLLLLYHAGQMRNLWFYFAGYMVVQLGNGIASGAYNGVIPDLVPVPQRGEASGYMAAMSQTGSILGAFGAGFLMGRGAVAASYGLIILTLIVCLCLTLVGVKEQPIVEVPPFDWRAFVRSFWISPRKHPDFAWVWITRFLVTLGQWSIQPQLQYYLEDVIRVKNATSISGYLLGLILIAATPTGLLGGALSDRIGRKPVVYAANTFMAAIAILFCFVHSLAAVFVAGVLFGLGYGAYYSVDWALGCDVLPNKEDAAKDMGVWHVSMALPQSLALPMAGFLLSRFPHTLGSGPHGPVVHYSLMGFQALFAMTAFFFLLGALFLRKVRGVR